LIILLQGEGSVLDKYIQIKEIAKIGERRINAL
jgi:hypothetical protein